MSGLAVVSGTAAYLNAFDGIEAVIKAEGGSIKEVLVDVLQETDLVA
ncbi:MAG: hypothetical protein F6K54_39190, partial [Okeania sp. SIO3B5]|nr:hypothetical protein [Okeania sp. SIO3B5]